MGRLTSMRRMRRAAGGERGQSVVEFALTLPIILYALFGVIDMGLAYSRYVTLTNAAREGVRYGAIHPLNYDRGASADPNNIKYVIKQSALAIPLSDAMITVYYEVAGAPPTQYDASGAGNGQYGISGNYVRATISYSYIPLTPFLNIIFPSGQLTLQASAVILIE